MAPRRKANADDDSATAAAAASATDDKAVKRPRKAVVPLHTLPACRYGSDCHMHDLVHKRKFSHPCKYGTKCFRSNPTHMIEYIHTHVPRLSALADLPDANIAFTGEFYRASRREVESEARHLGARVQRRLGPNTDLLIVGSKAVHDRTKMDIADKLGIHCIPEGEWCDILDTGKE
eukprot:m.484328 g.484328  ORF g.484328 m.484328 type:complete len:176 (+) comp23305_c0_seq1:144-671(+)